MAPMRFCPQCAKPLTSREAGGRTRLACPDGSCGFVHWGNPAPVVAALIEHPEGILLVRNKGWPEKFFGLVSGFLETGETPEAGVLREVKEELGLDATIVRFIGVYAFEMRNEVVMAWHLRADGPVVIGDEIEAYKAIHPDKLRPWPMGTGLAVRDWIAARKSVQ